jgi:hypothetical protein
MRKKQKFRPLAIFAGFSLFSGLALYQTVCNRSLKQQSAELHNRLAAERSTQIEEESKLASLPSEKELAAMRFDHAEAIRLRTLTAKLRLDLESRTNAALRLIEKEESRWVRKWKFNLSVRIPKDQALIQAGGQITPGKHAFAVFFAMIFPSSDQIKIDSLWFEVPDELIQNLGLNQTAASPDLDSGHYFISEIEAEALLHRVLNDVTIKVVKPPGILTSSGRESVYSMPDLITTGSGHPIHLGPVMKILPVRSVDGGVQLTVEGSWKIEIPRKPD